MRTFPFHVRWMLTSLALLVGCKGASPGAAASPPGSDPAGQKLDEWLSAFNAADRSRLERVHAGFNPAVRASNDLQFARQSGGFELHQILDATSPTERIALVRAKRTGRWRCLKLAVERNPPHGLEMILLPLTDAPTGEQGGARLAPFDDGARREVVDALARELERAYVFPDKAAAMGEELRARQNRHAYDTLSRVAFERTINDDLQRVSHDGHLHVAVGCSSSSLPPSNSGQPAGPVPAGPPPQLAAGHGGEPVPQVFGETRRLDGNVAYIDIRTFKAHLNEVGDVINRTMNAAADASALIIDLRYNDGGQEELVTLVTSHLSGKDAVALGTMVWRSPNKTETSVTDPNVPGPKFGAEKPVYVLTSEFTFSAGESLAYDLQARKRAVIVGEKTGGGAHPGDTAQLPQGFSAFIPAARVIHPVTKTDWEGVGVKPDVAVPADKALEKAHQLALERVRGK